MYYVQVLVLPQVVRQVPVYLRETLGDLDSGTSSNVYSQPERVILAWLNYHYCHQRHSVPGTAGELYI